MTKQSGGGIEEPLAQRLWEQHLRPLLKGRFSVLRAYANGQMFSTDGSPHRDACPSPPHYTLLYYTHSLGFMPNDTKKSHDAQDHQGDTLFFGSSRGQVLAAMPTIENSAILFPGCLLHAGLAPAARAGIDEFRLTVAFKLQRDDDS